MLMIVYMGVDASISLKQNYEKKKKYCKKIYILNIIFSVANGLEFTYDC